MKLMFAADPGGCQEDGRMFSGTGMFCGQANSEKPLTTFAGIHFGLAPNFVLLAVGSE